MKYLKKIIDFNNWEMSYLFLDNEFIINKLSDVYYKNVFIMLNDFLKEEKIFNKFYTYLLNNNKMKKYNSIKKTELYNHELDYKVILLIENHDPFIFETFYNIEETIEGSDYWINIGKKWNMWHDKYFNIYF
jgi:hypothetical protein